MNLEEAENIEEKEEEAFDEDLVSLLAPRTRGRPKKKLKKEQLDLFSFFVGRGIPVGRLALATATPPGNMSYYSRGLVAMPERVEFQLLELKEKIQEWETKNNRIFPGK